MIELGTYGPFAFGAVVLLSVWKYIVKPELKAARDDRIREHEENRKSLANAIGRLEERLVYQAELLNNIRAEVVAIPDRMRNGDSRGSVKLAE